jgi:hypothetical protein
MNFSSFAEQQQPSLAKPEPPVARLRGLHRRSRMQQHDAGGGGSRRSRGLTVGRRGTVVLRFGNNS